MSITRKALTLVISFIVCLAIFVYIDSDEASAAPAPALSTSNTQALCCVNMIDPKVWASDMRTDFKEGDLKPSRRLGLPEPFQDAITNYAETHQNVRVWWRTPQREWALNYADCAVFSGVNPLDYNCLKAGMGDKRANAWWGEYRKVRIICGGAAVTGSLKGGGWTGAGLGTAGCLWSHVAAKMFD